MNKFIVFSFFLIFLFSFTKTSQSQWQPDVRLTNDPANTSASPNNAWYIASSGNIVHVVFCDLRNGNWEIYYKRSTDSGVSWGTDTRLTNNTAESWDPSVSVTGSVVHIVWTDNRDGNYEIYYKRSTDAGVSWVTDTRLTNFTGTSMRPSIFVSGSVVHVVWHDNRDGNDEIYYKYSTDGGVSWGTDTRLTNNSASSIVPSVAVSGQNVHVVWQDYRDGNLEIYYDRSTDGGVSWGANTRLTNNPDSSMSPSVSVSGSTVHIVWHDTRSGNYEIYYKRSTDGGINWQADTRLTTYIGYSQMPSVSVSGSVLHVVWGDDRDGNGEIYYKRSMNAGVSWESDTRLTDTSGVSMYPSVSVSGSAVHVVWMDNRKGNFEIYYKRNPTGNPAAISAVLNSVYRPNDSRTQAYNITLSDSLCIGQIDSVYWYVNDSLIGRQHTMTYPYKQGTTKVKLKIKQNPSTYDSTTANVTRTCWKRYTGGSIQTGLSYIGDNYLYAISTGDKVYRMDINGNFLCDIFVPGNILSSCSIDCDTTIYVASDNTNLYKYDKNCAPAWGSAIALGNALICTPTIDQITNRLYIGTSGNSFYGINKTTGGIPVWSYTCDAPIKASAVISIERKLFISTSKGTIYGFNLNIPTPTPPTWQIPLYDSVYVSPAVDTSGYFYVGSRGGVIYKTYFQTSPPNTSIIWQQNLGSPVTSSPVIDAYGNLYVGTQNGRLYSLKISNGNIKWYFQTDSIIKSTAVITPNQRIYFGNNKGEIFGLDTAKNIKFYYIDSSKISCAMLYKDGTLYFGNEAGRIFAIYDTSGGSKGPVKPIWGTFQNNPQRTGSENPCGSVGIQNISEKIPDKFELFQNYPNPFNSNTSFKFSIAKNVNVKLEIFDILSRKIETLVEEKLQAGIYIIDWRAEEFSSGVYFYRIEAGDFVSVKKLILLK